MLKKLILPLLAIIIFNGCIVKQSSNKQKDSNIYHPKNRYEVPNMPSQNKNSKQYFLPENNKRINQSDKQLENLINGTTPEIKSDLTQKSTNRRSRFQPNIRIENEVEFQKDSNKTLLLDDSNIEEVESEPVEELPHDINEIEDNIIHVEMQGMYNDYIYPVSMRKSKTPNKKKIAKTVQIVKKNKKPIITDIDEELIFNTKGKDAK